MWCLPLESKVSRGPIRDSTSKTGLHCFRMLQQHALPAGAIHAASLDNVPLPSAVEIRTVMPGNGPVDVDTGDMVGKNAAPDEDWRRIS